MAKRDNISIYQIARFAEWAGDTAYARSLYADFAGSSQYELFPEKFNDATDVIVFVSRLRAVRLGEPATKDTIELAQRVFSEGAARKLEPPKPLPLKETSHLRGVVHRTDVRTFEMRAYLTDLSYEKTLYRISQKLSSVRAGHLREARTSQKVGYRGAGGSWVVEGALFQQVSVTDFGLIKSDAVWTRRKLPKAADEVARPFQAVLDELDPTPIAFPR